MIRRLKLRLDGDAGQISLTVVLFFLLGSFVVLSSFAAFSVAHIANAREVLIGKKAYITAESGLEDLTLRVLKNWNYNKTAVPPSTSLSANGGTVVSTLERDGYALDSNFPKRFELSSVGSVLSRHRSAKLDFEIPDEKLAVSIKSAIHAGYLGVDINNTSEIHGSGGYNKGDVFSNGSIVSTEGGRTLIDGNVAVAEGIGNTTPQQYHNADLYSDQISSLITTPWGPQNGALGITRSDVCSGSTSCFAVNSKNPVSPPTGQYAKDAAQSFIANTTAKPLKVRLLMNRTSASTPPGTISIYIRGNMRVRQSSISISCMPPNSNGNDPYGDCVDLPTTSGNNVASRSLTQTDLVQYLLPVANKFYWVEVDFTTSNTLIAGEKYWLIIDGQCQQTGGCNITEYYEIAGFDGNYTYGIPPDVEASDAEAFLATAYDSYSSTDYGKAWHDEGQFFQFTDYTVLANGLAGKTNDIAFQLFLGEAQTKIKGNSTTDNYRPDKRGSSLTRSTNILEVVGNAAAQFMESTSIGGVAYYKALSGAYPQKEVKAGGEYGVTNGAMRDDNEWHGDPDKNNYLTTPINYQNWVTGPYRWHEIDANQYECQDTVQGLNSPAGLAYKKQWSTPGGDTNVCNQPRYTSDSRWHCWDFYCSCNWDGQQTTELSQPGHNRTVDGPFCDAVGSDPPIPDDPEGRIPSPREPFGMKGTVLSSKKLRELKIKAMSLGVYDPCAAVPANCSAGTNGPIFNLTSQTGVNAVAKIPGITPAFGAGDSPYLIKPVNRTAIAGGYIRGNVRLDESTILKVLGRVPDWMVNGNASNPAVSASTTLQNFSTLYNIWDKNPDGIDTPIDMKNKCPYNVRHGVTNEERARPCYVLWISGDLDYFGSGVQTTGEPPPDVPPEEADYSIFIIVEGRIIVQSSPRIYAFPHPSGKSHIFLVSNSAASTYAAPAITLNGSAEGGAFLALRGSIASTQNVNINVKALVAQWVYVSGGAKIYFDDGLKSPFSDSGGFQVTGANFTAYYEKK
ncbi:MAG: hypothetical protein UX74_C0012G0003 [Parcubacteria group bacterium GW2011_GWA2_47_10b]|nr:MAG: hypothetical protein UX74_C0012G0003 [Parcubacteria group bacterium GW2011_GWA2_47_10b]